MLYEYVQGFYSSTFIVGRRATAERRWCSFQEELVKGCMFPPRTVYFISHLFMSCSLESEIWLPSRAGSTVISTYTRRSIRNR